jgi:hypothetical protein
MKPRIADARVGFFSEKHWAFNDRSRKWMKILHYPMEPGT